MRLGSKFRSIKLEVQFQARKHVSYLSSAMPKETLNHA